MPTSAMTAYTRTDTSASGATTSTVPNTERNVIRHMSVTEANTPARIQNSFRSTVSFVAAMGPILPVASSNEAPETGLPARQLFTAATTRPMVPARWSARNIITGTRVHSSFSRPVLVSMYRVDWVSCVCSRGMLRHLRLPSFHPALASLA